MGSTKVPKAAGSTTAAAPAKAAAPKAARAISYVQAWHRPADGGDDYTLHAQYHDKWVKIFGVWKLSERRLKTAGTSNRSDGPNLEPIGRV